MAMPSSSWSSRERAVSADSSGSTLPPGNSHFSARCLCAGRWAMSTRPCPSSMTAATTGMEGDGGTGDGGQRTRRPATFRAGRCSPDMKTFFKVLLIVVAVIVAVKLLPVALVFGCIAACLVAALAVLGVSLAALTVGAAIVVAAVLSPVWVPVLAIVGLVALCRRGRARA